MKGKERCWCLKVSIRKLSWMQLFAVKANILQVLFTYYMLLNTFCISTVTNEHIGVSFNHQNIQSDWKVDPHSCPFKRLFEEAAAYVFGLRREEFIIPISMDQVPLAFSKLFPLCRRYASAYPISILHFILINKRKYVCNTRTPKLII